jgi:hypothetical protein
MAFSKTSVIVASIGQPVMALICNSNGVRMVQIILAFIMIWVGGLFLRRSMKGRIRLRMFGVSPQSENANLLVGVVASISLLFGTFTLLAALLGLDC